MNRRNFNKVMGISVATPLVPLIAIQASHADDSNPVDPASPQASAVAFKSESDDPDKNCANCGLFSSIDGTDNGNCIIFSGSTVPAKALCNAYQPKK